MTPKYSLIFYDPTNIHKIFIPPKIYISENPQKFEIQNFEPKKMARAYACMKISEYRISAYSRLSGSPFKCFQYKISI